MFSLSGHLASSAQQLFRFLSKLSPRRNTSRTWRSSSRGLSALLVLGLGEHFESGAEEGD
jgi:hypothetical protein